MKFLLKGKSHFYNHTRNYSSTQHSPATTTCAGSRFGDSFEDSTCGQRNQHEHNLQPDRGIQSIKWRGLFLEKVRSASPSSFFSRKTLLALLLLVSLLIGAAAISLAFASASKSPTTAYYSNNNAAQSGYTNSTVKVVNPYGIAVNTKTGLVYVASTSPCGGDCASYVDVIGQTNSVVATVTIPGPFSATDAAVNPNTNMVYVTTTFGSAGSHLVAINGSTNNLVKDISITGGPAPYSAVAVNPTTNMIYVTVDNPYNPITVVNGATYQVTPISLGGDDVGESVAVNPNTNTVYVSASSNTETSNTLFIINGVTNTITKNITMSNTSYDIAVDPATNRVFVLGPNDVYVLDGSSGATLATISINSPQHVVVINNGQLNNIYVTSAPYGCSVSCPEDLFIVKGTTYQVTSTILLGQGIRATFLGTNPLTSTFYTECCGNDVLVFIPASSTSTTSSTTITTKSTTTSSVTTSTLTTTSIRQPTTTSAITQTTPTTTHTTASSTSSSSSTGQSTSTTGIQTSTTTDPQAPPPGNTTTGVGNSAFSFSIIDQQVAFVAAAAIIGVILIVGSILLFQRRKNT